MELVEPAAVPSVRVELARTEELPKTEVTLPSASTVMVPRVLFVPFTTMAVSLASSAMTPYT